MLRAARLGDRTERVAAQHPGDGRRRGADAVTGRDVVQRRVLQDAALLDRRVRHDRQLVVGAPRQQVVLRSSPRQVVQHLIRGQPAAARHVPQVGEGPVVEVADAPVSDFPVLDQLLEGRDRVLQRVPALPVQQVEVDPIGAQAFQAAFAGRDRAGTGGVGRHDLADQERLVAATRQCFTKHLLRATVGVHLGGVDQRHAQLEAGVQRGDLVAAAAGVLTPAPGALAQHRDELPARQRYSPHPRSLPFWLC